MKKYSILVVDDEAIILHGWRVALTHLGYDVACAPTGEDAIAKIKNTRYDLVLTDLVLPDIDGIEILRRVKSQSPGTPVIIITGYAALSTAVEALRLGADDYVLKPSDTNELHLRIKKCLEKAEIEEELQMHHKIVAATSDKLAMVASDYRHMIVNPAYAETFKPLQENIGNNKLAELFGPDFFETEMAPYLEKCFGGEGCEHRTFFSVPGNGPRFLCFSYEPCRDRAGQVSSAIINIRDITDYNQMVEDLQKSRNRLRLALDISSDGVWDRNLTTGEVYYGENWAKLLGYTLQEVNDQRLRFTELLHPEDKERVLTLVRDHFENKTDRYLAEFRLRTKNGEWQWILARGKVVKRDAAGQPLRFIGTHTDISTQKQAQTDLLALNESLEEIVEKRTNQLDKKTRNLEEMNAALSVLLKKREQDKIALEEQMVTNVKVLVSPYLEKIKRSTLSDGQKTWLDIMETNLNNVVSPFLSRLSTRNLCFTPTEIQIANFIKDGKSSKEIAQIMNLSPETISNHRKHIRKKSGITNQKTNLRTILDTFTRS
jgi:PAS domain S-box-containing protein